MRADGGHVGVPVAQPGRGGRAELGLRQWLPALASRGWGGPLVARAVGLLRASGAVRVTRTGFSQVLHPPVQE